MSKNFYFIIAIAFIILMGSIMVLQPNTIAPSVGQPPPSQPPAPFSEIACTSDDECPSPKYSCEEIEGVGVSYPDGADESTSVITMGICKLKDSNPCQINTNCLSGLCHANVCISPIGRQCNGVNDKTCPIDFECTQGCGFPVTRDNEPPPPYFCELKGYIRPCPICLAKGTLIDTPAGPVAIEKIIPGQEVWTAHMNGARMRGIVTRTSHTPVPSNHRVVRLVLADGRTLSVSPHHPIFDGRLAGAILPGTIVDGSAIISADFIPYAFDATYDILISGPTSAYWAEGILMRSTLATY